MAIDLEDLEPTGDDLGLPDPNPTDEEPGTAEGERAPGENVTDEENQGGGQKTKKRSKDQRKAEDKSESGVGGKGDATVSILKSPSMRWFFDPNTGKWYVSYQLPNSDMTVFYEATGDQLDAIFGKNQRPSDYTTTKFDKLTNRFIFAGDISEVEGTGSFNQEVKKVIALATDEGKLPSWAENDPEIYAILYVAVTEGKSEDWMIKQISKTDSFGKRFPGIQKLEAQGLTLTEAITGFLEFETGVKQLFNRRGLPPSAVTPDMIGSWLAKGHSLTDVQFVYDAFDTLQQNKGAMQAFNQVLKARGMEPLDKKGQIDFLAGTASQNLYKIWEEASFNRAAKEAGLDIGTRDAMKLARRTEGFTGYDAALEGLTQAASSILRFRTELDLNLYDIDQEDLIDLSLGLAPSSGKSQAELARNIERALNAARAGQDGPRANRFRQFSDQGVPQGVSTQRARTAS